jgi:DNA-3-methyladenine glycosylase II
MPSTPATQRWAAPTAHLLAADPRWRPVIERFGPCPLRPSRDRLTTLVRAIVAQQISAKAARSISQRLFALTGRPVRPEALLDLGEPGLRSVGLSGVKARYVLNLAEGVRSGAVPLNRLGRLGDDQVIAALTSVKGIGVWTAEMFLIFALNRPDVLPVGDLGIRVGLQRFHGLDTQPHPRDCPPLAEPWRPHRTIAMWYLWRLVESPPVPAPAPDPEIY